jgi:hypothetical protein
MNRKVLNLTLAVALSVSMAALDLLPAASPARAVTNQTYMQPLVREDYYPSFDRRYPNMPGTNFRAARPEEYPRIFGGDCDIWRAGRPRSLFDCEDFFPRKRRNPVTHDRGMRGRRR